MDKLKRPIVYPTFFNRSEPTKNFGLPAQPACCTTIEITRMQDTLITTSIPAFLIAEAPAQNSKSYELLSA